LQSVEYSHCAGHSTPDLGLQLVWFFLGLTQVTS